MKYRCFILLFFINLHAIAQTKLASPQTLSPGPARQDLDSLYAALKENHPDVFAYRNKEEVDREFAGIKNSITEPLSRTSFLKITSAFIAGFRDGHAFMDVNFEDREFKNYDSTGGRFFPLPVAIITNKIFAGADHPAGIKKGDEILAINHHSAHLLLPSLLKLTSADGEANGKATLQRLFGYMVWLYGIQGKEFTIQYTSGNRFHSITIPGIDKGKLLELVFNTARPRRQMHVFPEYSLAVIEINSYVQVERSKQFIDSCFRIIKAEGIRHVALDLRSNGGGNSYIGDYLLSHITKKAYSTVSSKTWRLGPMINALPKDHFLMKTIAENEKEYSRKGQFLHSPVFQPRQPAALNDTSLFVDAKFFLLVSARTYSSAHMTALAVKCGGLGTIIGQPTGERLDLTGEIIEYVLPHSKLIAVIPTAAYTTSCGNGKQVGVEPDVVVQKSLKHFRDGVDAEMEVLKKMVLQTGN